MANLYALGLNFIEIEGFGLSFQILIRVDWFNRKLKQGCLSYIHNASVEF